MADIARFLKAYFPWLGTSEEVSGADVIDVLSNLYETMQRKPARITKTGKLQCPYCQRAGEFEYIEDIGNSREVNRQIVSGVLKIEGLYKTDGLDDGEDGRLQCQECYESCDVPAGVEVDFA